MSYFSGIFYKDQGEGEPIVFLSGLGGECKNTEEHASYYRKKGFRTIQIDFPLMGSSKKKAFRPRTFRESIRKIVEHLNLESFILYGYSIGCTIAVDYVTHYSDVSKLVLIASGMPGSPRVKKLFTKLLLSYVIKNFPFISYSGLQYHRTRALFAPGTDERVINEKAEEAIKTPMWKAAWQVLLVNNLSFNPTKVNVPTLIINAEDDNVYPKEDALKIHRKMKNSTLVFLKDCNHMIYYEKKDDIVKHVLPFLNSNNAQI